MTRRYLNLPAPAKLNLFLHITGRRPDGYHELQSVFVPISLADTLDFESRDDGQLHRTGDVIGPLEGDLVLRAAKLLQSASATAQGASINVEKRIPAGSGLGGGSSNAATTLLALNRLWNLNWPREKLAALALQLGADVPFFLGPGPAFVEGIGERLTPLPHELAPAPQWAIVVHPPVHVSTADIFKAPGLTRKSKPVTIRALSEALRPDGLFGSNTLQAEAIRQAPLIQTALDRLNQVLGKDDAARMTGSGSAVFALTASEREAQESAAALSLQHELTSWAVRVLGEHPLSEW